MKLSHIFKRYPHKISISKMDETFFLPSCLVFIVTSRCNFFCKHCFRDLNNISDLPFDIAQKVLLAAKKYNFKSVGLTGGEPLLYPRFRELIDFIVEQGYSFSVVTNGYILKEFIELFEKYRNKINFIAFSLESADPKKNDDIRHSTSYDKLLEDFSLCRRHKIPFRIVTCASTLNQDELFDIALFAKKKGAQSLAVTTILPCPRSKDNRLVLDSVQRQKLFLNLRVLSKMIKFPILICADIRGYSNMQICNNLSMSNVTVDMEGNILLCCELANYDVESIRKKAVIASLKEINFDDALKKVSEYIHRFNCMRIEDYKTKKDKDDIDFNS